MFLLLSVSRCSVYSFIGVDNVLRIDPEIGELLDMFSNLSMGLDYDPDSATPLLDQDFASFSDFSGLLLDHDLILRDYFLNCVVGTVFQHEIRSPISAETSDGRVVIPQVVLHEELFNLENDIASIPRELDNHFRTILDSWGVSQRFGNCTADAIRAIPEIRFSFTNGTIILYPFDLFELDESRNICFPKFVVNNDTSDLILLTDSLPGINVMMNQQSVYFCDSRFANYLYV